MSWFRSRSGVAAVVAVLTAAAACGGTAGGRPDGDGLRSRRPGGEPAALGPGEATVRLDVEHSRFVDEELRVVAGTEVTFVLDNGDPIGHELIVGPQEVHDRHASGTHAAHGAVPGEVSVGPNDEATTTYRFTEPGTVEFACHLPGHYEYGMHGTIEVVAAD